MLKTLVLDVTKKQYARAQPLGKSTRRESMSSSSVLMLKEEKPKILESLMKSGHYCKKKSTIDGRKFVLLTMTVGAISYAETTFMKLMIVSRLGTKANIASLIGLIGIVIGKELVTHT